ncbi:hypothetical protein [Dactylosporangium sp. CA-233914]|uniref:hypothetical protein n=1 Tax=Dactylosporangium sp. CA-233914 TaxID=3239934 RepID=UPI003D8A1FB1
MLPEGELLSLLEFRAIRMEVAADVDGFAVHPWQSEPWMPFQPATGIDLRPGRYHGRVGIAPNSDGADFCQAWPSLGAYLTAVAGSLERGTAAGVWKPFLPGDGELWWSAPDDLEVNGEPLRPAPATA